MFRGWPGTASRGARVPAVSLGRVLGGLPHAPQRCPRLRAGPDSAGALQPSLSLDKSVTTRFVDTGAVRVTVQAACGSSVLQDSRVIRVLGESVPGRPCTSVRAQRPRV